MVATSLLFSSLLLRAVLSGVEPMVGAQLTTDDHRKRAPATWSANRLHRLQTLDRYSPQASRRAGAMALQHDERRRPRWSIWKVGGSVYLGAFIAYAFLYSTKYPLGSISDVFVQSLAFALIWGWLAGVVIAMRNRLTASCQ